MQAPNKVAKARLFLSFVYQACYNLRNSFLEDEMVKVMAASSQGLGNESISGGDIIKAAGGLLWRNRPHGAQLAVINRRRYGDWTLPKGKLTDGETWEDAALREVREETGCEASLDRFAGTVSYVANGTPKTVLFWNMQLTRECDFQPSEEVAEVVWLTVSEALQRLDYEDERHLLTVATRSGLASPIDASPSRLSWWERLLGVGRDVANAFRSHDGDRLTCKIHIQRVELSHLRVSCENAGADDFAWAGSVEALIKAAEEALRDGNKQRSWEFLHAAERMELFGIAALSRVGQTLAFQAHAQVLWQEAGKLPGWRRNAVAKLLTSEGELRSTLDVHEVYAAAEVLHDHFSNVYRRLREFIRQLAVHSAVGLVSLSVLLLTLRWPTGTTEGVLFVSRVLLLGMLGASLSVLLSLRSGWSGARIPMLLGNRWVNLTRLLVGAIAALAAYLLLNSGLLQLGPSTPASAPLTLTVAFASGFTERLVVRAIESVARAS